MTDDAPAPLPPIPTSDPGEALIHLRRPFTPAAVKWKTQVTGPKEKKEKTWATIVGYIDSRLVSERLNMVVAGDWSEEAMPVEGKPNALLYALTVLGQRHIDVGIGQGQNDDMKLKGVHSDALKRVAVRFGIGAYLYAMPPFNLYVTPNEEVKDGVPTLLRWKNGKAGHLKAKHEAWLREEYERWLESEGIALFGEPLDHGDARTGSVGVLVEGLADAEEAGDEDLRPAPLEDEAAKVFRGQIANAYEGLCKVNPDRLTRGRLDKMVEEAAHSHAELERVATTVESLWDTENQLGALRHELAELVGSTKAKPLIDSAERRGSQEERIAAMQKALTEARDGDKG